MPFTVRNSSVYDEFTTNYLNDGTAPQRRQPVYPEPRQGDWINVMGLSCVVLFCDNTRIHVSPLGVIELYAIERRALTPDSWRYMEGPGAW